MQWLSTKQAGIRLAELENREKPYTSSYMRLLALKGIVAATLVNKRSYIINESALIELHQKRQAGMHNKNTQHSPSITTK